MLLPGFGFLLYFSARWIARRWHTPDRVVFLPCFWPLAPGAVGLTGISEIIVAGDTGGRSERARSGGLSGATSPIRG